VQLRFSVGSTDAVFSRSAFTGKATLAADGENIELQDPWNPATHFSLKLIRTWQAQFLGHEVVIEKRRPLLFAAFRSYTCRVFVDGQLVVEETGR
jgi:hypothetical protein